ncbi:MAG: ABC transporter permease [Lachnospiraceae bacterium]|nr:ABC transporter permease [Lachnospiraceae bacterium]
MKLFSNRFGIMLKRTIKQPVYIIMLLLLISLSIFYVSIPAEKKSLYITAAVLCEDSSPEAGLFMEELINSNSVFTFYEVENLDELKKDVISGKANSGFVIPEGYIYESIIKDYDKLITEYVTAGSFLPMVAFEEIYARLFKYTSYELLKYQLFEQDAAMIELESDIKNVYENYDIDEKLFNTDKEYEKYAELTKDSKMELPIRKIAGLFIYIAAILGTAAYITDRENNIYLLMSKAEKISLRFIHIMVSVLPLGITTFFIMLILKEMSFLKSAVHVFIYMMAVSFVSLLFGLLFKKSKTFYKFLPLFLVLTMVFSGVFFDIGKYNVFMGFLAKLCPPYYF